MDVTADLLAPCSPERLFGWVDDLAHYPEWLDIVPRATPVEARDGDPGPAWSVDLRGRLGPFARSKRLRMVRTVHEAPERVRFDRLESIVIRPISFPSSSTTGAATRPGSWRRGWHPIRAAAC